MEKLVINDSLNTKSRNIVDLLFLRELNANDRTGSCTSIRLSNLRLSYVVGGYETRVRCIVFDRREQFVITGSNDNLICTWNLSSGKLVNTFDAGSPVLDLALNEENTLIAVGCQCKQILILDLQTFQNVDILSGHTACVEMLHFASNTTSRKKHLLSTSRDGSFRFWRYSDYNNPAVFESTYTVIEDKLRTGSSRKMFLSASPKNEYLATANQDGYVRIYQIQDDFPACLLERKCLEDNITCLLWAPSCVALISASIDGSFCVLEQRPENWNYVHVRCPRRRIGRKTSAIVAVWSADSSFVFISSEHNAVKVWNANTWEIVLEFAGQPSSITIISANPVVPTIFVYGCSDGSVIRQKTDNNEPAYVLRQTTNRSHNEITAIKWTSDGLNCLAADACGNLIAFDTTSPTMKELSKEQSSEPPIIEEIEKIKPLWEYEMTYREEEVSVRMANGFRGGRRTESASKRRPGELTTDYGNTAGADLKHEGTRITARREISLCQYQHNTKYYQISRGEHVQECLPAIQLTTCKRVFRETLSTNSSA